ARKIARRSFFISSVTRPEQECSSPGFSRSDRGQRVAGRLDRPVQIRLRVRGADRALLARKREMVDAPLDERAAVAAVEVEIVARRQLVPVRGDTLAEIDAEGRADPAHRRGQALL